MFWRVCWGWTESGCCPFEAAMCTSCLEVCLCALVGGGCRASLDDVDALGGAQVLVKRLFEWHAEAVWKLCRGCLEGMQSLFGRCVDALEGMERCLKDV